MPRSFPAINLAFLVSFLSACATDQTPLPAYSIKTEEKLAPINLVVDAGRYVTAQDAQLVSHLYEAFSHSNLFAGIETNFFRSPFTVVVKYTADTGMGAGEFAGAMVSASTLMLVPSVQKETHAIEVALYVGNERAKTAEYTETAQIAMSLYNDPVKGRKQVLNRLVEKALADMRASKLIPTMGDFERVEKNNRPDATL
jgi:hypothetical protein